MGALHQAALVRAYRTLAQGLGGSAVSTALVAVVTALAGGDMRSALIAAGASVGTTLVAAFASFWQGIARGLPEAPEFTIEQADEQFAAERADQPGRHEA